MAFTLDASSQIDGIKILTALLYRCGDDIQVNLLNIGSNFLSSQTDPYKNRNKRKFTTENNISANEKK